MLAPRGYLGVARVGEKIYAMGGMRKDTAGNWIPLSIAEVYDPARDSWQQLRDMPAARGAFSLVAASNGKLYAIGGADAAGQLLSTVDEYDPGTDSWTSKNPMPTARFDTAAAAGLNGKIYVFGGLSAPTYNATALYEYDPATDAWAVKPDIPRGRDQASAAAGPDGRIYIVGGGLPEGYCPPFVDIYDPAAGTWTAAPDAPFGVCHAGAIVAEGALYVLGGGNNSTYATNLVQRLDLASNQWSTSTSLPTALRGLGAAVGSNGRLYAIGGDTQSTIVRTVYEGTLVASEPLPTTTFTPTPIPTFTPTMTPTIVPGQNQMAVAYQVNPAHDGNQADSALMPPLVKKWSLDFGQAASYPLIARGKVFVTVRNADAYGTKLYALDAHTGAAAWGPIDLGGLYWWSGIAYDDGRIFAVNFDGVVRAFSADTGVLLWESKPGQYSFDSPPTALQGVVYVGGSGGGGTLFALSAETGDLLWSQYVENGDHSSPALSDDGVFVSYACNRVYRFNRWNGTKIWDVYNGCSGGGGRTPVYYGNRLYVRDDAFLPGYILDPESGAKIGSFTPGPAPAFAGNLGYFLSGGTLSGRNLETQTDIWTFRGDGSLSSAPLVVGSTVYVGGTSGVLYALDALSGTVLWSETVGSAIPAPDEHNVSQPLTGLNAGEGLLVVPAGGRLVVYEAAP